MFRTRLLILLLSLAIVSGCGYGFTIRGQGEAPKLRLLNTKNDTTLVDADIMLDTNLQQQMSMFGILSLKKEDPAVKCTVLSYSTMETTSNMSNVTRYKITLQVKVQVLDIVGNQLWGSSFSDEGTYELGQEMSTAVNIACNNVSNQIAQALMSVKMNQPVNAAPAK